MRASNRIIPPSEVREGEHDAPLVAPPQGLLELELGDLSHLRPKVVFYSLISFLLFYLLCLVYSCVVLFV